MVGFAISCINAIAPVTKVRDLLEPSPRGNLIYSATVIWSQMFYNIAEFFLLLRKQSF